MIDHKRTVLVTGGTGHQGGAAARHLIADGWHVRALVRDPHKPAALALANAGAELFVGDLRDRESLDAALAGAYGAYSVQTLADGPEAELLESKNLADAAKAAEVEHFVYSSVIGADRDSDRPWVRGKVEMERYLSALDLPLTIWRPVPFMENFLNQKDSIEAGTLTGIEAPDVVHQWIAVDDVGRFVALAFQDPQRWVGQVTEIAGDEVTGPEAADAFSAALGLRVRYEQTIPEGMPAPQPPNPNTPPARRANITQLRTYIPDLITLRSWAARHLEEFASPTFASR